MATIQLFILFTCIVASFAHLCLISPPQRGTMNGINKAGAKDCFLTSKPCGGRGPGNTVQLRGGQMFNVTFQKNLDHYMKANPGYFTVNFGSQSGENWKELTRINDGGEPSLSLYTPSVTIPAMGPGNYILQATYVTKNPGAPAIFFQCSDVILTA